MVSGCDDSDEGRTRKLQESFLTQCKDLRQYTHKNIPKNILKITHRDIHKSPSKITHKISHKITHKKFHKNQATGLNPEGKPKATLLFVTQLTDLPAHH